MDLERTGIIDRDHCQRAQVPRGNTQGIEKGKSARAARRKVLKGWNTKRMLSKVRARSAPEMLRGKNTKAIQREYKDDTKGIQRDCGARSAPETF